MTNHKQSMPFCTLTRDGRRVCGGGGGGAGGVGLVMKAMMRMRKEGKDRLALVR